MLKKIHIRTMRREEARDITDEVQRAVAEAGAEEGFVIIYVPHDSAAVSIHRTLEQRTAPKLDRILEAVNPDHDTPEYTKAAFVAPTEVGVIAGGRMVLGDDQRVYFYEFSGPAERSVYVYVGA
ncbi:MAG: secondary thiamine-phosphate synthase enzyme YjbQ [Candidatus Bipolaricaulota bacterium]